MGTIGSLNVYGNDILIQTGNTISEYNATTGALINGELITPVNATIDQVELSGTDLYISSSNAANTSYIIGVYDAVSGTAIDSDLISAASGSYFAVNGATPDAYAVAAAPEPRSWAFGLMAMALLGGLFVRQQKEITLG